VAALVVGTNAGLASFGRLIFILESFIKLPERLSWVVVVPIGTYVLALLFVGHIAFAFRCPRCGYKFYLIYGWGRWAIGHNGFARKCGNCGLRKWSCG
jgi:hypothetical protein